MKKLHTILLIDDDPATNFLHKLIIKKENCANNVICKQSAQEALDYLKSKIDGEYPNPELIFLDINMPGMNGWDFLTAYKTIDKEQQAEKVVIMLTTSVDPLDKVKAKTMDEISDFSSKPLTSERLRELLTSNFPKLFEHN